MTWREFAPTDYNADPISGGVYATLVGSDPLETSDGDAAYVETYLQSGDTASLRTGTFRLSPTPSGSFTRVKVATETRGLEGFSSAIIGVQTTLSPDAVFVAYMPDVFTSYETHEVEIDFAALPGSLSWVTPDVVMSPDSYWFIQNTTGDGLARTLRTTWLRVYAMGGLRPLQHRQRTDAYGVGGVQAARTRTTFQSGMGARYPV